MLQLRRYCLTSWKCVVANWIMLVEFWTAYLIQLIYFIENFTIDRIYSLKTTCIFVYLCLFFTSHIGEVEQDRHPTVQRAWAWNLWYIPWISGLPHLILTQDCEIDWDSRRHNAKLVSEPRANASRSCSDSIFQAILFLTCLILWKLHT